MEKKHFILIIVMVTVVVSTTLYLLSRMQADDQANRDNSTIINPSDKIKNLSSENSKISSTSQKQVSLTQEIATSSSKNLIFSQKQSPTKDLMPNKPPCDTISVTSITVHNPTAEPFRSQVINFQPGIFVTDRWQGGPGEIPSAEDLASGFSTTEVVVTDSHIRAFAFGPLVDFRDRMGVPQWDCTSDGVIVTVEILRTNVPVLKNISWHPIIDLSILVNKENVNLSVIWTIRPNDGGEPSVISTSKVIRRRT